MNYQRLNWLETQLDREDLSQDLATKYNHEANIIQGEINDYKKSCLAQAEAAHKVKCERIRDLVNEGRMQAMVDEFGSEFVDDYSITENFTVLSIAHNKYNPEMPYLVKQFPSLEAAQKHVFMLVYWRVYTRYFRFAA